MELKTLSTFLSPGGRNAESISVSLWWLVRALHAPAAHVKLGQVAGEGDGGGPLLPIGTRRDGDIPCNGGLRWQIPARLYRRRGAHPLRALADRDEARVCALPAESPSYHSAWAQSVPPGAHRPISLAAAVGSPQVALVSLTWKLPYAPCRQSSDSVAVVGEVRVRGCASSRVVSRPDSTHHAVSDLTLHDTITPSGRCSCSRGQGAASDAT